MKRLTINLGFYLMLMMLFSSCGGNESREFPTKSKWEAENVEIDFDIDCECTDEQKMMMKGMTKVMVDAMKEQLLEGAYIEFFEDKTYKARFDENIEHGKYEIQNDGSTIETRNGTEKEYLYVKEIEVDGEKEVRLVFEATQSELAELSETEYVEGFGPVTYALTVMKLALKRVD